MAIQKTRAGKRSLQLSPIIFFALCLTAVPAMAGEPVPPGQFTMQWLAMSSLMPLSNQSSKKPTIEKSTVKKSIIESPYRQEPSALPDDFLRVVCRDKRWHDYAASLGGEHYLKNLCLRRFKQQKKSERAGEQ